MAERIIYKVERLTRSRAGKPRWRVTFVDGSSAVTKTDASVNYYVDNVALAELPVEVIFNRSGRIIDMIII